MAKKNNEDLKNSTKCCIWNCIHEILLMILKQIIVMSLDNVEALHIEIVISRIN